MNCPSYSRDTVIGQLSAWRCSCSDSYSVINFTVNRESRKLKFYCKVFQIIFKVFNILSKNGHTSITEEDIESLNKNDLRQICLMIERYEPSNTYTYEYSYVREEDIR